MKTFGHLTFKTLSAVTLWHFEFQGQISDGMWENSRPYDHWKFWCHCEASVGETLQLVREFGHGPTKTAYNFGALREHIGDRMMTYGRFGKVAEALGKPELVKQFGDEHWNFDELEKLDSDTLDVAKFESEHPKCVGLLTPEFIAMWKKTTYTLKDFNKDVKDIKAAMKNDVT